MIFGTVITWTYYNSVYKLWLKNRANHNKTLNYYYHVLDKQINSKAYQKPHLNSSQPDFETPQISFSTIIYDIKGREIGKLAKEQRRIVALKNVSKHFRDALIATEDRNYKNHNGVDIMGILRAVARNLMKFRLHQGGSTLTQQLAKLLFTNREKTIKRKIYEMFIAREIERKYSKDDILLMYVNYVYFGHGVMGIEEAAKFYFNKKAKYLDIAESALLAGLISNPTIFSPFINPENAKARHLRTLKGMVEMKLIPQKLYKSIHANFWKKYNFKKLFVTKKFIEFNNKSPYVVEEVKRQIIRKLKKRFDNDIQQAHDFLFSKGWRIYTTIDLDIQKQAIYALQKGIYRYRRLAAASGVRNSVWGIQGALVAINPKNGYISAFVGGYNFNKKDQFNRAFQAHRQPGSAFKPFVYLAALEKQSINPFSTRLDSYKPIELKNGKVWKVRNYQNSYTDREITLTEALKISSNQIAAQLISEIGVKKVRDIIQRSLDLDDEEAYKRFPRSQYSIALGTSLMTPLELAQAYAMIANEGNRVVPRLILKIQDLAGETILLDDLTNDEKNQSKVRVVSRESAYQLIEMMRQVLTPGGTGWIIQKLYNMKFDVAGKTGTSQKYRDLWFAGFTPELCSVVWIGHDKDYPLSGGGGMIAGPIFGQFMTAVSKRIRFTSFFQNDSVNLKTTEICAQSGLLAVKDKCPNILRVSLQPGTEPTKKCDLKHDQKEDALNTITSNPNATEKDYLIDSESPNKKDKKYIKNKKDKEYLEKRVSHLDKNDVIADPKEKNQELDHMKDKKNNDGNPELIDLEKNDRLEKQNKNKTPKNINEEKDPLFQPESSNEEKNIKKNNSKTPKSPEKINP